MADEITKCPLCGTKLKKINGRMTCQECGYRVSGQNEGSAQYSSSEQNSTKTRPQVSPSSHKGQGKAAAAIGIVVSILASVMVALYQRGVFDSMFHPKDDNENEVSADVSPGIPTKEAPKATETPKVTKEPSVTDSPTANVRFPVSSFFRQMAEAIWGKSYWTITAEEYANLTALQINRKTKEIYYQLNYGETKTLTYTSDANKDFADLSLFTGLEWISVEESLSKGDLDGLNNLWGIYADNTIEEYLDMVPEPDNILELGIKDSIFEKSLKDIDAFPNLRYLSVDYGSLEDISALTKVPGLIGLAIVNCDRMTDYSPLMSLNGLESLKMEASQLKTIDFVRVMPNLTTLSIEDSAITGLDALASCEKLTYLSLVDNSYVEDYSVVGDLESLESLTLKINYGGALPSFEKLSALRNLDIKYAGDLSPLKDAVNVTYLSMERCSGHGFETIASMKQLTTLIIHDFSSYVDTVEPLLNLPNLTTLDLSDTSIFGNIEDIFNIPTLRYLCLNDCQIGLDFDKISVNETLQFLALNNIRILNDPTYNKGDVVKLSEHYDMFQQFPNLVDVSLISNQIDSIEFVESLPYLQYLDITNNNVTSLKPLASLENFIAVWCGKNSILEKLPENSPVIVFTTER